MCGNSSRSTIIKKASHARLGMNFAFYPCGALAAFCHTSTTILELPFLRNSRIPKNLEFLGILDLR
ncbi:MAG: hypothetical protein SOY61_03735 [Campylobacter sp.]|nr:hypothetical protein [Campylobacter sp.]